MKSGVRELALIALHVAVISILARFALPVPFSPVPLTGQMVGVFLAGSLLGSKKGAFAVFTYILLGISGAPVLAMGRAGPGVLFEPSGWYLLGFLPGVFILGLIMERSSPNSGRFLPAWGGMLACLAITYLCGVSYFMQVLEYEPAQAAAVGILPFLPGDLAKIALTVPLAAKLIKVLGARPGRI